MESGDYDEDDWKGPDTTDNLKGRKNKAFFAIQKEIDEKERQRRRGGRSQQVKRFCSAV